MDQSSYTKRLELTLIIFAGVLVIGTVGFKLFEPQYTWFNSLYMTVITISTIGFTEIVDASNNVGVRVFTIFIAFSGIGVLTYLVSNVASLIIEGNISENIKRKNMEKKINSLEKHFIICGCGNVGMNIVNELLKTKRQFIIAGKNEERIKNLLDTYANVLGLVGDPTDDDFLLKLGVAKASGLFVTTGDDNINLVVCVSAKHLNPGITIVAECNEIHNIEKLKIAGADKVISPTFIGGLRMASEMIRPTVTTFLDEMMRGTSDELRVEEVKLSGDYTGKSLKDLKIEQFKKTLLMSLKIGKQWTYHPQPDFVLPENTTLIVMTTPEDRLAMEKYYGT